eukprot:CAMPEP_0177502500 /NCGR_PEP_ID=MMETSP0369-20130122/37808_1 /TAXON_ID=447022 ORGANISM="Scrippsiella hangoei-like, Strain SHHI-4" /NCGR_SAMPLE_ID=MMETSP0369 /ASSEMBLY_ACC=CAM_ASM_000364 /LENGTH=189 /DNA_ID=CAMNT_0018980111 /DNA_START=66 /DNA_END=631 /DNA_ORIENTATION=+
MARVGVANYALSRDSPVKQDSYWRLAIERGQRDHNYSPFNEPCPKASYAYLSTTSNDFQSRTWQVLGQTRQSAAGKSSFHHNVAKPEAGTVKAHTSSHTFERNRGSSTPFPRGASAAASGRGMLQSSSAPALYALPLEGRMTDGPLPGVLQEAKRLGTAALLDAELSAVLSRALSRAEPSPARPQRRGE